MGLYRRFICKLKTAAPFQKSVSLNAYSNSKWSRISEFFQPVSRYSVLHNVVKNNQRYKSPFLDGFFHNLNSRNVYRTFMLGGLVGCGAVYCWHLERVPYTNRSHFVLLSTSYEKKLWESTTFETSIESEFKGKRLPPLHPSSITVQRIGQEIVEAAQKGLRKEDESLILNFFKKLGKRDYHQIPQFEWEFVVVDSPKADRAFSGPGGKIGISTCLLDTFESDAEIAAVIAHEVGHGIARHYSERRTILLGLVILNMMFLYWNMKFHLIPAIKKSVESLTTYSERHSAQRVSKVWCPLISLILKGSLSCLIAPTISKYLILHPYSRRDELEADYIGLILMASAGYDPRGAPGMYEKIGSFSRWKEYVATHPCGKTRAQKLSQPQVMEEALTIHRKVQAQAGV